MIAPPTEKKKSNNFTKPKGVNSGVKFRYRAPRVVGETLFFKVSHQDFCMCLAHQIRQFLPGSIEIVVKLGALQLWYVYSDLLEMSL